MATLTTNGIQLYYESHGDGIPLMLIAGLASDSQSWQTIWADTARHCRVIAPDNRGVGRTTPQDVRISIQDIADDCIALVRHLDLPSVNLLGHSMGGFVALDMAIRYPDRVNKLILAGTAASNSRRNNALFSDWASGLKSGMDLALWFRSVFRWLFSARFFENERAVSDAVRLAVEYPYPQSVVAFENQVKAIANFDCSEGLARIRSKTLVIGGREDRLFPVEVCAGLARAIPGAVLAVTDNAAHSMHVEQPRAFTDCFLDFLRG
jgi:pimeloyl-ACP methyl ester carboxylesterase